MEQILDLYKSLSPTEQNIALAIVGFIVFLILLQLVSSSQSKRAARDQTEKMQREADWYFEDLEKNKKLTT